MTLVLLNQSDQSEASTAYLHRLVTYHLNIPEEQRDAFGAAFSYSY